MQQVIDSFRAAMREAGINYSGDLVPDAGRTLYIADDNDPRRKKNIWYQLHTDGLPAGAFGSFKTQSTIFWCFKNSDQLTPEQKREWAKKQVEIKAKREAEIKEMHDAAADQAEMVWSAADEATAEHPYCKRKGIQPFGARVGRWTRADKDTGDIWLDIKNSLLVPIYDGRKLSSLQAIFPAAEKNGRDKDYLSGGKKHACFTVLGNLGQAPERILIVEGYSTGCSVHEATQTPVVVAFDANNLKPVAERVRRSYPLATLVICADSDKWTEINGQPKNVGVIAANEAAQSARAWVAVPEFESLDTKPTDFNDLHQLQGLQSVKDQIEAAIKADQASTQIETVEQEQNNLVAESDPVTDLVHHKNGIIDTISPLPDVTSKGRNLATIENLQEIQRRLGVTIRYNCIKKEDEIIIPGERFSIDNGQNASLAWLTSWCERFQMPTGKISDYVTYIADKNLYNPVATWITSKPWDGQKRIYDLLGTVKAKGEDEDDDIAKLKCILILRWMVSAVAAAFKPDGVSARGMLVFQGEQNIGKTYWLQNLIPDGLFKDGVILDLKDKDSQRLALSHWIVELGEVDATFKKSHISQLKAFLTNRRDQLRRAYARKDSVYARRTVFFASVNPEQFLVDTTGNTRFWTVAVESINNNHGLDAQQIWAEIYETMYLTGASYYLTKDEEQLLNESNKRFDQIDPTLELLMSKLNWEMDTSHWCEKTITDILFSVGVERPTISDCTRAAMFLRKIDGVKTIRKKGKNLIYAPPTKH